MIIKVFNYYSHWIISLSLLYIIGYYFNIELLKDYVNLDLSLLFINIGFLFLIIYLTFIRKYYIDFSLFILLFLIHLIPLILIRRLNIKNNYNIQTFLVTIILYCIYMIYNKTNPIIFYLNSNHPKHINDLINYLKIYFT
jgi:hypothetical protein